MTYKRLHHIGIVLPSVEQVHAFAAQYGLTIVSEAETSYEAAVFFSAPLDGETPIEFLVPSGGPLLAFNHGKGGMHHICFEVDDIAAASAELRAMDCQLLEDEAKTSDDGMAINFVRPRSSFGVLVELMKLS